MRGAADTLKRVTLELGGKSPNIVFADADIDSAVKGAINGIFYGKGEVCNAGSRLFLESKLQDEFIEKLVARAKKMQPARSARSEDAPGRDRQPGADADRARLTSKPGKKEARSWWPAAIACRSMAAKDSSSSPRSSAT